jgi:WD40 repeat protein
VFSPDGACIVTASEDNTARLWHSDGKPLAILEGHTSSVKSAVFSPDGGRLSTGHALLGKGT